MGNRRLLLIDLSAIFWRNWHATKDQELGSAFESTIKKVRWLASSGYDGCAVCCDAPPYWRKKIAPEYKAQRDQPEPAAVDQLHRVMARLEADGFPLWKAPGFEADDVIASATTWAVTNGCDVHIASADKDLMALVSDRVQLRSTSTDDVYDTARVVEKFGVKPWQMPSFLALVGDKSDNVKGVAGVGAVKARELVSNYESVAQLAEAVRAGVTVGTPAINAALKAGVADGSLDLSLQLVTLRLDVDGIEWEGAFAERKEKPLANTEVTDADFEDTAEEKRPASTPPPPITTQQPGEQIAPVQATAIVQQPSSYGTALEPKSAREAFLVAKSAVAARVFGVSNPDTAFAMILRGRALGLDAITSLTAFHIIKDKLTLSANLIEGMVQRAECCEYFMCVESTDKSCTYKTKRRNYPAEQSHTWTIEDAQRLGLIGLDQWKKQPRTMLRHRCSTDFARMVYADVVAGLYSSEEMQDVD
jgi:DNA polymerase-1